MNMNLTKVVTQYNTVGKLANQLDAKFWLVWQTAPEKLKDTSELTETKPWLAIFLFIHIDPYCILCHVLSFSSTSLRVFQKV